MSIKTKFDRKVSGKMWFGTTSRLNFAIEEQWFDMRSKSYIHIIYIYRIRTTMTKPYARIFAFNFGSSIKLHVRLPTYIDDNYCTTGGKLGSKSGRHFHKWNQNIARFIWNAEISIRVPIHCYECLF